MQCLRSDVIFVFVARSQAHVRLRHSSHLLRLLASMTRECWLSSIFIQNFGELVVISILPEQIDTGRLLQQDVLNFAREIPLRQDLAVNRPMNEGLPN